MLWHIRKDVGKDVLLNRGHDEVMINMDFVKCDVVEFRHLSKSGEFEKAIHIYQGQFMQGFFFPMPPRSLMTGWKINGVNFQNAIWAVWIKVQTIVFQ
ncbi:hypothetical protein [Litoribacter populi]|uniref:hypothetical protein n=1 Tax=Litoribacter populi TaxID=2598460 RepID=UPI00117D942B|nr:hypothetical protein [Litoribacter populi]